MTSFRPARPSDVPQILILSDMAARGLMLWRWSLLTEPGQSALEVGRQRLIEQPDLLLHFSRWTLLEKDGEVVAGFVLTRIDDPMDLSALDQMPEVFHPIMRLSAKTPGAWSLSALAVFADHRRKGLAQKMLEEAERQVRASDEQRLTLLVETPNLGARRLYESWGFVEIACEPFIGFPGCRDEGDWHLLQKTVA